MTMIQSLTRVCDANSCIYEYDRTTDCLYLHDCPYGKFIYKYRYPIVEKNKCVQ